MGFGPQKSTRSHPSALAEINVTPLVDVMLVLLIVFMISAPLMQQGVQVDLPKAQASSLSQTPEQIVLVVKKSHELFIGERRIEPGTLKQRLSAIVRAKPQVEILIQGDLHAQYGVVAQVMAEVKRAGIHRVGLVTEPGESSFRP